MPKPFHRNPPRKPLSRKYQEYKETAPRNGRVSFFNNPLDEGSNDGAWKQYREWIEQNRRELAGTLAETEQASSRQHEMSMPELHALKALADELGVENDISWDAERGGHPFVSRHNPWLDQPADIKRAKAQSLLSRISNALHPQPEGGGGGGGNSNKKQEGKKPPPKSPSPSPSSPSSSPTSPAQSEKRKKKEEEWETTTPAAGGGGEQHYGDQRQESIFLAIRRLLQKLAEETDYSQVVENGRERWDAQQLLIGKWNPTRIPQAKRDFATRIDHIYLSLDTSGSVDQYTTEIASMAAGAAGIVHLYTGTEGKPQYRVERHTPLQSPNTPFPEWENQTPMSLALDSEGNRWQRFRQQFFEQWKPLYPSLTEYSFELDLAWLLEVEKPKPGARLLFWGDTRSVYIFAPRLLAHLVRKYRFAWLFPYTRKHATRSGYTAEGPESIVEHANVITDFEWQKLEAVGLPVLFEVVDAVSIQRAMRELQSRKSK